LGTRPIEHVRKLVNRHLADRAAVLENATFTVYAEVRGPSGGLRRVVLAKWSFGDDLDDVFKSAFEEWHNLKVEEDYASYESDILLD
jgi:hypothetical protein